MNQRPHPDPHGAAKLARAVILVSLVATLLLTGSCAYLVVKFAESL
jgi:flagellar biogenesis protein FliO